MGTPLTRHEPFGLLVWDTLQELMYERRFEPYSNLHELKKAMRPKWNEVYGQTIKESYQSTSQHSLLQAHAHRTIRERKRKTHTTTST